MLTAVLADAGHPVVAGLLGLGSAMVGAMENAARIVQEALPGGQAPRDIDAIVNTRVHDNSLIVDMRSTERLVPRLVAAAEASNIEILDLAVAEPSLETVFINLTGKELREA